MHDLINSINRSITHIRAQQPHYLALMRVGRPIGTLLLLWPTLWALWLAAEGFPSLANLLIFCCGVFLMRSAGCVINDYADRNIDGHVRRTKDRPLARGKVSENEALLLFASLCTLAFLLVLFTNKLTILLSFVAVLLASIYPFMKRHTYFPQLALGAAFSWAVIMAFAAETAAVPRVAWLLYIAVVVWTVAYDTYYAMVDREDDLKIGVKSTAILFGAADRNIIAALQVFMIIILVLLGTRLSLGMFYYLGVAGAAALFAYQYYSTESRDRDAYFNAFLNNHWVGCSIFAGIFFHYLFASPA